MSTSQYIGERETAEVTYEGSDTTDSGAGTVMDFSDVPFGAAETDRIIKILVYWATAGTGATIAEGAGTTIGGIEADVDHQAISGEIVGGRYYVGIISAAVPTGTSGAVQITFNDVVNSPDSLQLHCYSVLGLISATPIDVEDFSGLPNSDALNAQKGGVVLFGVAARNSDTAYTLTGVTEDFDASWTGVGSSRIAAGSTEIAADDAAYSVGADTSGTGVGTMASYR